MSGGRGFAYAGAGVGLGVSIWANVAHAATRPPDIPETAVWSPEIGAVAVAGFWPLILFLALEVLTRTAWAGGRGLVVARAGVAVVASVAAIVSYLHLHALLVHYGEPGFPAAIGPLAIDGLMAVSAAALLTATGRTDAAVGQAPDVPADVPAGRAPAKAPDGAAVDVPDGTVTAPRGSGSKSSGRAKSAPGAKASGRGVRRPAPATDADLVARVGALVTSGALPVEAVTATRLRSELGVGAVRADRIHAQWTTQHPTPGDQARVELHAVNQ